MGTRRINIEEKLAVFALDVDLRDSAREFTLGSLLRALLKARKTKSFLVLFISL